jgi:RimJ/RimL family protein N-acetyltransferase
MESVVLEGSVVRLEPMGVEHHAALAAIGCDPELWRFTASIVRTPDDMLAYIKSAMKTYDEGSALPFVTMYRPTCEVVGSTRFRNYDPVNRGVEIGFTWLAKKWQRTAVNTEAKYLMLAYAFETLGCVRVELRTHVMNARSRAAMLRIGAREEGIRRKDLLLWNGEYRDSVYYSILNEEWPEVKLHLRGMMR